PGDTVTARGRKELSVVETAGNTCFTHPSRGPWRIEERQLSKQTACQRHSDRYDSSSSTGGCDIFLGVHGAANFCQVPQ
ncbi:hypothetical protein KUCAC02_025865, partial [Chaenocephalus aceratus]